MENQLPKSVITEISLLDPKQHILVKSESKHENVFENLVSMLSRG